MRKKAKTREGKTVTVVDVARIARVSPITVSRALNAPERVSPKALERVQKAVKRTGYVPNLLAGGLRSAKTRLVAAVVPTISGPVFQGMIQALTDALDERGYQLLVGQSGYQTSREDALLDAIIGRRPIGIVLTGMMHSVDGRRRILAAGIPVVETWDLSKPAIDMAVGFSHEAVGEAVCEYLFRKGRRRVAVLSGEDERAARRTKAFVAAAERLGLPPPVVKWISVPTTLADGREGLAELLRRETALDAVWCSSDLLALGVLTEAHARGVAVPGSLAVIGFGNLPFAAGVIPSLTTVHIDGVRIGRTAAELIITRAAGEKVKHSHVDVSFSIIPRDSA